MEKIILEVLEEGKRLDSYIAEKTELTRTRIQMLIKEENISVNNKKSKSSYKVEKNDLIEIIIPDEKEIDLIPENIDISILYEDSDLAVIDKKAGIVVHPSHGHESGTLVNAVMYHIKDLSGINGEIRPGIVHRLDKDTSGLLIIAKNDTAHLRLSEMFSNNEIVKTYVAILKGKLNKDRGGIETLIGRDPKDRKKMAVVKTNGKKAVTHFQVLDKNEKFSLVKVNIKTGRTHQIRVHMRYLGYPVLGDKVYGRDNGMAQRQMLHAYKLEFLHPVTQETVKITSELPGDFKEALLKTGLSAEFLEK
jgi:23S rRNA pseudouridine1911/1915/1917 synthase